MKWANPEAVMLARIQGTEVHCRSCIHEGRPMPGRRKDNETWCAKRVRDPNPYTPYKSPTQVCRHWEPDPDYPF